MARNKKYNEPTKMFSQRVPESKIKQVGELVREFLDNIQVEDKPTPEVKSKTPKAKLKINDKISKPVSKIKKVIDVGCDCYLDEKGLFRRGKSGCKKIKQDHKF